MAVFRRIVAGLLVFQLAIAIPVASIIAAENSKQNSDISSDSLAPELKQISKTPEVRARQAEVEQVVSELQSATENQLPGKSADPFHLVGQTLEIRTGDQVATHNLSQLNVNLTPPYVTDFMKEVEVKIDREAKVLSLDYISKGVVLARHKISGFEPVAFARDQELLVFLNSDGKLFAIDMAYARNEAFRTPLPVVNAGNSGISVKDAGEIHATFLTRGLKSFDSVLDGPSRVLPLDKPAKMTAGDFVLYVNQGSSRLLAGVYDRSVVQSLLYSAESILSFLASRLAPSLSSKDAAVAVAKLQADPSVREQTSSLSSSLSEPVRDALLALPADTVTRLVGRSKANQGAAQAPRDQALAAEMAQEFERLRAEAFRLTMGENNYLSDSLKAQVTTAYNQDDLGKYWKILDASQRLESAKSKLDSAKWSALEKKFKVGLAQGDFKEFHDELSTSITTDSPAKTFIHDALSSRAVKIIATITAGGAAVLAGQQLLDGNGPAWAVHVMNQLYEGYIPEVLKDTSYRVTLLQSSLLLSAYVPLMHSLGALMARAKGGAVDAVGAIATIGFRIYAVLQLPFFHYLPKLVMQPHFIRAMQAGINPLKKVRADSELGRALGLDKDVRVGLSNPFQSKDNYERADQRKVAVRKALIDQGNRTTALALTLASFIAAGKGDIDPATLVYVMQSGGIATTEDVLETLSKDPKAQAEWHRIAQELIYFSEDLKSSTSYSSLSEIPPSELVAYYESAKKTAEAIRSRTQFSDKVATLKLKWKMLPGAWLKGLGSFGLEEFNFLTRATPSKFVSAQFWKQFVTDFLLAIYQMAVVGDRAHLSDPQALAADPKYWHKTNPGHLADMSDQVRIYMINAPSSMALVYQRAAMIQETLYRPIEEVALIGRVKAEGYFKGIGEWVKGAGNLRKANYGGIFMRDLVKRMKTVQAGLITVVGTRILLGGQVPTEALLAFVYVYAWATWQFGWPWTPITKGNEIYGEHLEELASELGEAKAKVGRGLRLDEREEIIQGSKKLMELYSKSDVPLPEELKGTIQKLETLSSVSPEAVAQTRTKVAESAEVLTGLANAINSGDAKELAQARAKLMQLYQQESPEMSQGEEIKMLEKLNAISLLEHALKNPPFATAKHPYLEWTTTMVGAVLTTYWATTLMVDSFRPDKNWATLLPRVVLMSAAIYTGIYFGQKWINAHWDGVAEKMKMVRNKIKGNCGNYLK